MASQDEKSLTTALTSIIGIQREQAEMKKEIDDQKKVIAQLQENLKSLQEKLDGKEVNCLPRSFCFPHFSNKITIL